MGRSCSAVGGPDASGSESRRGENGKVVARRVSRRVALDESGQAELRAIVGALLTVVLILAVLMLVICAAVWAISSANGNITSAVRARTGFLVSVGAAALTGLGVTWVNFLLGVGASI